MRELQGSRRGTRREPPFVDAGRPEAIRDQAQDRPPLERREDLPREPLGAHARLDDPDRLAQFLLRPVDAARFGA